jgi:hypothetical protein
VKYGQDLRKYDTASDSATCTSAGKNCLFAEGVVCSLNPVDPTVDLSGLKKDPNYKKVKLRVTVDSIDGAGLVKLSYNIPVVPPKHEYIKKLMREGKINASYAPGSEI